MATATGSSARTAGIKAQTATAFPSTRTTATVQPSMDAHKRRRSSADTPAPTAPKMANSRTTTPAEAPAVPAADTPARPACSTSRIRAITATASPRAATARNGASGPGSRPRWRIARGRPPASQESPMHGKECRGCGHHGSGEQTAQPPGLFRLHVVRCGHPNEGHREKTGGQRHGRCHKPEPQGPDGCQQIPCRRCECNARRARRPGRPAGVVLHILRSVVPAGTDGLVNGVVAAPALVLAFAFGHSSSPRSMDSPSPEVTGVFAGSSHPDPPGRACPEEQLGYAGSRAPACAPVCAANASPATSAGRQAPAAGQGPAATAAFPGPGTVAWPRRWRTDTCLPDPPWRTAHPG